MNVGVVLIGLILVAAASIGIIAMASYNQAPPSDTFGHTLSTASNDSHDVITSVAAPAAEAGGGLALAIAVLFIAGMLFAVLGLILYSRAGNARSGR